jgi:hypothetical protein
MLNKCQSPYTISSLINNYFHIIRTFFMYIPRDAKIKHFIVVSEDCAGTWNQLRQIYLIHKIQNFHDNAVQVITGRFPYYKRRCKFALIWIIIIFVQYVTLHFPSSISCQCVRPSVCPYCRLLYLFLVYYVKPSVPQAIKPLWQLVNDKLARVSKELVLS